MLFFLNRYAEQNRREMRRVHPEAMRLLREHDWPGNVRELQNYVERAVILGTGAELQVEHLPPQLRGQVVPRPIRPRGGVTDLPALCAELVRQGVRAAGPSSNDLYDRIVGRVERELIQQVLQACDRVQIKAAARLGINRNTLHKKLSEFRLDEAGARRRPAPTPTTATATATTTRTTRSPIPTPPRPGCPTSRRRRPSTRTEPRPAIDLEHGSIAVAGRCERRSDRSSDDGDARPTPTATLELDRLYDGDCLELFRRVGDGSVDLIFADPPFNIGYDYDIYDDRRDAQAYLDWTLAWGREVVRVLKPDGTFWLAIGDEFAAELKVLFHRELGLSLRNWVVWYYTFGVHCTKKFTRSHAHLFYFVRDPKRFTFNDQDDPRALGAAVGLLRRAGQPGGPAAGRHLDPPAAGRARRLRRRGRHLVLPAGLRDVQGAGRLARLPDARAAPGPDHPRLLEPRRGGARPVRRQRHDAGGGQEAGPAVPGLRALARLRRGDPASGSTPCAPASRWTGSPEPTAGGKGRGSRARGG